MRTETVDLGLESDSNIAVLGDAIPQLCVEHLHLEPAGAGKEGREGEAGQRMHGLQSVNRGAASGVWAGKLKASLSQIGLDFSTVFWKGVTLTLSVIMKRH